MVLQNNAIIVHEIQHGFIEDNANKDSTVSDFPSLTTFPIQQGVHEASVQSNIFLSASHKGSKIKDVIMQK